MFFYDSSTQVYNIIGVSSTVSLLQFKYLHICATTVPTGSYTSPLPACLASVWVEHCLSTV